MASRPANLVAEVNRLSLFRTLKTGGGCEIPSHPERPCTRRTHRLVIDDNDSAGLGLVECQMALRHSAHVELSQEALISANV
jgi:hypothetical protein